MIDDIDEFESIALIRFPANIAAEIDKEIKAEEDAIKVWDHLNSSPHLRAQCPPGSSRDHL